MRLSRAFAPTLKESPADAQVVSHVLMVRGGFIRRVAAGIYSFLPLGWRVLKKIEAIVREEMDRAGAQEVLMPAAVPAELWQESGRWDKYGPELLRFKDRKGADFCIGPTHEEVIVEMVRRDVSSYRQLPQNLYQVQAKFRDEMRPRAGLMRGREFIMKDAYSFDVSEEKATDAYDAMYAAYRRIFTRCGLDFRAVEADTGAIGGSRSHEFQVLADSGEDAIVSCGACDYAANVEQAVARRPAAPVHVAADRAQVATPGHKTIDEVSKFLGVAPGQLIKCLVYMADGKPVAALVRGDRALNEIALRKAVGATAIYLARDHEVVAATGVTPGFVGPIGLTIPVIADVELEGSSGMVGGANAADAHVTGVELARDAGAITYGAIRMVEPGDGCPRCASGTLRGFRGIEVGHVFFLGTKYSAPMHCNFLAEDGTSKPMVMGCYGIGITRVAAAAIEQNHDTDGIKWPIAIAPFHVAILSLSAKDEAVRAAAEQLYAELSTMTVTPVAAEPHRQIALDVVLDDRDERPGAKFKDADLIGVPLRIAVGGKSLKENAVELKWRGATQVELIPVAGAAAEIRRRVEAQLQGGPS